MGMTRRTFLGTSAAAVAAAGMVSKGQVFGANERIGVMVMGFHGRGGEHIKQFSTSPDSEVVALCDADERVLQMRAEQVERETGKKPATYTDIRKALEDGAVDALSIATPNHWHTLATVWGLEAGKHVYVEKPATHEIWEGQQLKAATKKYGKIVQHGTQSRSDRDWRRDIPLLQSGEIIGKLHTARGLGYKNGNRGSLGSHDPAEAPAFLHWDLWQGPAQRQQYNPVYHPYNWHWFWDYGNGEIGNQGVHEMDVAAWGMDKGVPVQVYSEGGRFTYDDMGQTPNTNVATFTYEDGTMLVFEVRNRWTNDEAGVKVGNLFYGAEGYYVDGKGFFNTKDELIELSESEYPYPESQNHFQVFLDAVKANDPSMVNGDMEAAHKSCTHCHMANISYRLGRSLKFDPKAERFVEDEEANAMLKREYHPDFEVPSLA